MALEHTGILKGIKVISSSTVVAGPFAAAMLAENGADVIHLEHPRIPDTAKAFDQLYNAEHRNERTVALDIKTDEGKEIFKKLIVDADIFIESSRPGVWDRLGFTDEALWEIKPDLVICHMSGYGSYGDPSYLTKGAYDMIGQAFSGYLAINGTEDQPAYAKPYMCDYFSGLTAAFGVLAALLHARETGQGESIDVAMYETLARIQADYPIQGFKKGIQPLRRGTADATAAIDVVYKSKDDQWVVMAIASPNDAWIEEIGLADDPEFYPAHFVSWGHPNVEKYLKATNDYAANHTLAEILEAGDKTGMACVPVMTYDLIKNNSHYQARESIIEWYDPATDSTMQGMTPIPRFKKNPAKIFRGSPTLGMDNEEVLAEIGYSADEVSKLLEKGVLGKQ